MSLRRLYANNICLSQTLFSYPIKKLNDYISQDNH